MKFCGSAQWKESEESVWLWYRPSFAMREQILFRLFLAFCCVVGGPLMAADSLLSAKMFELRCDRASGYCTETPVWIHLSPSRFRLSALSNTYVKISGNESLLVGGPQVTLTPFKTHGPTDRDTLEEAAAKIKAFAASSDADLDIWFSPGDRPPAHMYALFAFLAGLGMLSLARNGFTRAELTLDRSAGIATQRRWWLFFRWTRSMPLDQFVELQGGGGSMNSAETSNLYIKWKSGRWPIIVDYDFGASSVGDAYDRLSRFFAAGE